MAFLLACLGVLTGISAVRAEPATSPGLVVVSDLPAGHLLGPDDVRTVALTAQARPNTALVVAQDVVGRALAGPMNAGEMLLSTRLVGPGLLGPGSRGEVAMPLRIEDITEVSFLRPGDHVDVLAAQRSSGPTDEGGGRAMTVARNARVLAVPGPSGGATTPMGSGSSMTSGGQVLVVAVPTRIAALVAGAATRSRLSVVLNGF